MHYYYEKEVVDRLRESARNQRNASFVREWRALQRANRPGAFATLVCRLTAWTPLQWCAKMPAIEGLPYGQATTSYESEGSSLW